MPSASAKQAKFMRAVAHSPEFAKKVGVPVSVGKEFVKEDKETDMKRYMKGGKMPSKPSLPSQASSKAASAMERFAGARGMLAGGSTKDKNPRKGGDLYNLGTNQNPKMSGGGKTKKMAFGGMSSMPNSIKGVPPVPSYSPPIIPGSAADTGSAGNFKMGSNTPSNMVLPPTPVITDPANFKFPDNAKKPTIPATPSDRMAARQAALAEQGNMGRGMDMRRVPTLPTQASQRARDMMARRMPITTPGGPTIEPPLPEAMIAPAVPAFKKGGKTGMAKGGMTKSRTDGCATRGKTRGRMV